MYSPEQHLDISRLIYSREDQINDWGDAINVIDDSFDIVDFNKINLHLLEKILWTLDKQDPPTDLPEEIAYIQHPYQLDLPLGIPEGSLETIVES
jgi:hypothetical protein